MRYAAQFNTLMVVVAVVAVGYAISQTVWQPAVVPLETLALDQTEPAQGPDDVGTSMKSEPGTREHLRRPASVPRTPGGFPSSRRTPGETTAGRTRPQSKVSQAPNPREQRRPAGARVVSTGPVENSPESEPSKETESASERVAETLNLGEQESPQEPSQNPQTVSRSRQGQSSGPSQGAQGEETQTEKRRQSPAPPPPRASNRQ